MYTVSLDISMRSTGVVVLSDDGKMVDFSIVSSKTITDEELMEHNITAILKFLEPYKEKIGSIVIEGLAFMGVCRRKDLLYGNYWVIRYFLWQVFGDNVEYNHYTVSQWRKSVISKERAKEIKEAGNDKKGWQKIECVGRLPEGIKLAFETYVKENKSVKKDAIYDLTDSYFMAKFKLLEKNSE